MRKALLCSVALLALACAVALAAVPVTGEITVNTGLPGRQVQPSVAMDADGDFAVVWEDRAAAAREIRLRRFSRAGGPSTGEITMDTTPADYQDPAVAMSATGAGVAAWQNADTGQIIARRFDADSAEGTEIPVDASTAAGSPDVAMDADGDFVVVWEDNTATPAIVRARRFDETGAPQGVSAFTVNEASATDSLDPAVAIDAAGNFVVSWEHDSGPSNDDVRARIFNANESPRTSDIPIAATTADEDDTEVAMDADGDLAVAWESGDDVLARRYNSAGAATTSAFPVHSASASTEGNVRIGLDAGGASLAVAWDSDTSGADEVLTRRFNASGTPLSGEVAVNTTVAGDQNDPALGADASGRFVVAWESPGGDENIVARRFDPGSTQPPGGGGPPPQNPQCVNPTTLLVTCANPSGRLPGVCGPSFASIFPACYLPTVPPTVCGPSFGTILKPCQLPQPQILACGGFGTILPQCKPAPQSVPQVCGPSSGTILPACTGANNPVLVCGPSTGTVLPPCNFKGKIKSAPPLDPSKSATIDIELSCPPKRARASSSSGPRAAQKKPAEKCDLIANAELTREELAAALLSHGNLVAFQFFHAANAQGRPEAGNLNQRAFGQRGSKLVTSFLGRNGSGAVADHVALGLKLRHPTLLTPPYTGPNSIHLDDPDVGDAVHAWSFALARSVLAVRHLQANAGQKPDLTPRDSAAKRLRVVKRFKIRAGKRRRVKLKLSKKVVKALVREARTAKRSKRVVPIRLVISYRGKLQGRRIPVARLMDVKLRVKAKPKSKRKKR